MTEALFRVKRKHGRFTIHKESCRFLKMAADSVHSPEDEARTTQEMLDAGGNPCWTCFEWWTR